MFKVVIHRKKQFASCLVPFYLVVNTDLEDILSIISKRDYKAFYSLNLYPIKNNKTIVFNVKGNSLKLFAMNGNILNSYRYPFSHTEEFVITNDSNFLLEQTNFLKSVSIEMKEVSDLDYKKIDVYDI